MAIVRFLPAILGNKKKSRRDSVNKTELVDGPGHILQVGMAFWPSKVLLTAIELNLFTHLSKAQGQSMTNEEIRMALKLHERATPDFTDALVSLNLLERQGNGNEALYSNTSETDLFLVKERDTYIGETLNHAGTDIYSSISDLKGIVTKKTGEIPDICEMSRNCLTDAKVRVLRARRVKTITKAQEQLSAERIVEIAFAFWPSRCLLEAADLQLFTTIKRNGGYMTKRQICEEVGIRKTRSSAFLNSLVKSGILRSEGSGADTVYSNLPNTSKFLDRKASETYVGGILEMCSRRLYVFWADLRDGLETGMMQNEGKESGWNDFFPNLYREPDRLANFMEAMIGLSSAHFHKFASDFDFSKYKRHIDIGGASGQLCCFVSQNNPHMRCTTLDLPPVKLIAEQWIDVWECTGRVNAANIDFLSQPFPKADVITMSMILHDWGYEDKMKLIKKAYDALPEGGAFVAIESIIDDERRVNTHGLCMSLNMLIEFGCYGGYDFTHADFNKWCLSAGFRKTVHMPLAGPSSAVIAYK